MAAEHPAWLRLLLLLAVRASQEALGDALEEFARGKRTRLWLVRQVLSTAFTHRPSHYSAIDEKGRPPMLSNVLRDVAYASRTLLRNPGFAAAAIAPIALGIGINTGLFSILNNVLFRSLPAPNAAELITVYQDFTGVKKRRVHGARSMFSVPEYRAYREAGGTLAGLTAYTKPWKVTLGRQNPEEIEGRLVDCRYFDVLQLRPAIGPGFTSSNCDAADAGPAVVISHALWTRAFALDPGIVGQTVAMNGQEVSVVGVAPPGFDGTELVRSAFFASLSLQPAIHPQQHFLNDPDLSWLTLLARRRERASLDEVRAEMTLIANRIDGQQPGRSTTLLIAPAGALSLPAARRDFVGVAGLVIGAFGLILLTACANVSNVLLARGASRSREIAIRLAIGAGRWRMVRLLLAESALIALVGGLAGSVIAWWSFQTLLPFVLSSIPGTSQLKLDAQPALSVLWFGLALTAATAIVSGVVPAIRASKQQLYSVMKEDGVFERSGGTGWLRGGLVAVQVAVCLVLLVGAALLLRALHAASTVDPGFEYRRVAVVSLAVTSHVGDGAVDAIRARLTEEVRSLPGVTGVAEVGKVPLSPGRSQASFRLPQHEQSSEFDVNQVSPEHFTVTGMPIVNGRAFTAGELERNSRAVIVTEGTARRLWPGLDPIGRTIIPSSRPESPLEVVGVAKNAHVSHVAATESSYLYLPAGPSGQRRLTLLVRSEIDLGPLATSVRAAVRTVDPLLLPQVIPLEANLTYWRKISMAVAVLSGSLGLLALMLGVVGVYGVVSYVVAGRRREVGIRMTLGATPRAVQSVFLREMIGPVGTGVLLGLSGAAAASRLLESRLYGISPLDPIAFAGAAAFLVAVATVATLMPTRNALKLDPLAALKHH